VQTVQFTPVAEHAVLVAFSHVLSDAAHANVLTLDKALSEDPPMGMTEVVPALINLLVVFDPMQTDHAAIGGAVQARLTGLASDVIAGAERVVEVCYEPPFSPDLVAVATATGLSEEAVINAHLSGDYRVLMYGFVPGFAYLGGLPKTIQVPRKPAPVRNVPNGSVIIAGTQSIVTTVTMPTGWSRLGRSPTRILTGQEDRPFLFDVGDRVTFQRIDVATLEDRMKATCSV